MYGDLLSKNTGMGHIQNISVMTNINEYLKLAGNCIYITKH